MQRCAAPVSLIFLVTSSTQPQILEDLKSAQLLADAEVTISTEGGHVLGADGARLTVIEFFDFECPYCGMHGAQTLPRILETYVRTGKLRYVFRNFPQSSHAQTAAEAAECAGEQSDYLRAHLQLLKKLSSAADSGFTDSARFQRCLESGAARARVKSSVEQAKGLKVPGTPAFYFGYPETRDASQVKAVKRLLGYHPIDVFQQLIDDLLKSGGGVR